MVSQTGWHQPQNENWATADQEDLGNHLINQIDGYYAVLSESGRNDLWRRSNRAYFGIDQNGAWTRSSSVSYGGDQGELVLLRMNHYRSILQNVHTLVTGTRPALQARASTDDHEAAEQTMLAERLIEWYFKRSKIEDAVRRAALFALLWGEGHVLQTWDTSLGDPYTADPETGRVIHEGDVCAIPLRPLDVVRDVQAPYEGNMRPQWYIIRRKVNRWDLLKRFPEHESMLMTLGPAADDDIDTILWRRGYTRASRDYVFQWELYHDKTEAVPEGRYALLIGDKVVLDGGLPYQRMPLHSMYPDVQDDTPFGYSPMFDLLAPQEALDSVISTAASNHDAFGVQNVWTQRGDGLQVEDLTGGLRHLQSEQPPVPVQLTAIAEDSYRLYELYQRGMETISGVNSVARGDPQASLKSGAALALIQSMSVQHNSGIQSAYARMVEDVGMGLVEILQTFVTTERAADITGDDYESSVISWKGSDIESVSRVTVELANPILQTAAGKQDVAAQLLDKGLIRTPEQYFAVIETGRLDPLYRYERSQIRLMREENERMKRGELVQAAVTDRHRLHIQEHAVPLSDPNIRFNPELAAMFVNHIQEHIDILMQTNPTVLEAVGEAPPTMPMAPPPGEGLEPTGGVEGAQAPGEAGPQAPVPAVQQAPPGLETAELPNMPTNPLTGERAQVGS